MTPLIVAAGGFVLFIAAMVGPQVDDLRWKQWHHEYLGVLLLAIALALRSTVLAWVGAACMADDGIQHAVQRATGHHEFSFILHRLYGLAWRVPLVRRLNAWLDERMR
jgi:hypothetical protein